MIGREPIKSLAAQEGPGRGGAVLSQAIWLSLSSMS